MNTEARSVDCLLQNHCASVVFNNPARHNAMSLSMWTQLRDILRDLATDSTVRAVVFSGAGHKAFVSGADISEFDAQRATTDATARYNQVSESADLALCEFPKPTIAKIRGYCMGGGLGLALGCDIRICTDDASFSIPAGKLGLGYSYRYASRLLRILGQARAMEIFYSAKRFGAEEALQMGVVNQIVPASELDTAVDGLVERITANAPLTLAAFKAAAITWARRDSSVAHDNVSQLVDACFESDDYAEGRRAFQEKRKPLFKGR